MSIIHTKCIEFGFNNSLTFQSIKPLIQLKDDMKRRKWSIQSFQWKNKR